MSRELFIMIYTVLLHWASIVGILSVVMHSRVNWRSTVMGRHLMFYMGIFASVLVLTSLRLIFGWTNPWFGLVYVVLFTGVPVAMTQRLWLQWKAQQESPAEETPPRGTPRIRDLR